MVPGGRRIAHEKNGAIYVVDLKATGNEVKNLTATHPAGARQDPEFLPAGQIVYIETFLTKQNVYRMEADGSNPTDLTPANADFLFSPASGSSGAVYAFTNVNHDILLLGGANKTNTADPVDEGYPDVSPGGTLMFTRCCGTVAGLRASRAGREMPTAASARVQRGRRTARRSPRGSTTARSCT